MLIMIAEDIVLTGVVVTKLDANVGEVVIGGLMGSDPVKTAVSWGKIQNSKIENCLTMKLSSVL